MSAAIRKVLIANRGEIALRVLRSCRELGIRTVAVYSDADRNQPHVQQADEARHIGGSPSRESYLRMDGVIEAALASGADAIHPGYGFLSENAEFARRVRDAGVIFIGPRPESIAAMGSKTEARALVSAAGVPTVPGTPPLSSEREAAEFGARAGFPILLKASSGGGGKGMRIVHRTEEVAGALRAARSEALSAFGDDRVYCEKYLLQPRHIEFQIVADASGATVHLGERECSIQRRHQKVIEETPSVAMNPELRNAMGATAVRAAKACGYLNAGTIEFLLDGGGNFYFLEMNTRLQVEHPITELRTGLDLVALQIAIAEGLPLPFTQEEVSFRGHAIECRICAEDVRNQFLPSTGRITHLRSPSGPGIREDRGVEEGGEIPVYYDSMIAKLVVWDETRNRAIDRMIRGLREYEICGVETNIPLCLYVLQHPLFRAGKYGTGFLTDHFTPADLPGWSESEERAVALAAVFHARTSSRGRNGSAGANGGEAADLPGGWVSQRLDGMR